LGDKLTNSQILPEHIGREEKRQSHEVVDDEPKIDFVL
jgi:hypothetical protein